MLGGGGVCVNILEAQITLKNRKKSHCVGVSLLNWGVFTPLGGGVQISLLLLACTIGAC